VRAPLLEHRAKPVVVYLMHGRPFFDSVDLPGKNADAIVDGLVHRPASGHRFCQHPLRGTFVPSGKTGRSVYPRSVRQACRITTTTSRAPAPLKYATMPNTPVFPLRLRPSAIRPLSISAPEARAAER